jgi:hypothetical protein
MPPSRVRGASRPRGSIALARGALSDSLAAAVGVLVSDMQSITRENRKMGEHFPA